MQKDQMLTLLLVLMGFSFVADAQKTASTQDVKELIQQSILLQATWSDVHTPHDAKFDAILGEQKKEADGTTKQFYEFHTSGIPAGKNYKLESWPIGTLHFYPIAASVRVSTNGFIVCANAKKVCGEEVAPGSPVGIWLHSSQGEPQRFLLSSDDDKVRITATVIPFPALNADKGCSLQLLRLFPEGQFVFTRGEGFPPHTDVTLTVDSNGKTETQHVKVTNDGLILNAETPSASGPNKSGDLRVTATSGTCHPSAVITWGEGSDKKL